MRSSLTIYGQRELARDLLTAETLELGEDKVLMLASLNFYNISYLPATRVVVYVQKDKKGQQKFVTSCTGTNGYTEHSTVSSVWGQIMHYAYSIRVCNRIEVHLTGDLKRFKGEEEETDEEKNNE